MGPVAGIMLRQHLHAPGIQHDRLAPLAVGSFELELVSGTHELNSLARQFLFQPSPIVACLGIVFLVVDGAYVRLLLVASTGDNLSPFDSLLSITFISAISCHYWLPTPSSAELLSD